jgi:superfamily II DNA or RNA helicase
MRIKPREEQRNVTKQVYSLLANNTSALVVAPTGYGKTVVMGDTAEEEIRRGGRVLVIVNLQVLLGQTVATMEHGFGIETSALHDGIKNYLLGSKSLPIVCDYGRNLLVTLPQTMTNTLGLTDKSNNLHFDKNFVPTMIIFDEAHKATSAEFQKIRNHWPDAKIVGFTATPYRAGTDKPGESLEEWYGDRIIIAATMSDLIERGDLAKPEYDELDHNTHVGKTWLTVTSSHSNKRTIVFTDDTDHSKELEAQFKNLNIRCEVVTAGKGQVGDVNYVKGQTPEERDAIFKRFHEGKTEVLISVNALCEGFDEKLAKFCFLTRKVGSIAFYQQMVGRVLRKCEDKPYGYIFDFAGNLKEHGRVEAIEWPRAAKGFMLEREEREMCAKSYEKRDKVWKHCENTSCGHVFNMKETKTCGVCNKVHVLDLISTVDVYISSLLGMNHTQFQQVAPFIRMAINNPSIQAAANKKVGRQIFDSNGKVHLAFQYIPEVIAVFEAKKSFVKGKYVGDWYGQVKIPA